MSLQPLTSLDNIKVGDCFTMITPEGEDAIIQFVGRNPQIGNEEYSKKSGYFATVFGPSKCFILNECDLTKSDTEFYIGYDEEFALEKRIEKITKLLIPLQDRLLRLREGRAEQP